MTGWMSEWETTAISEPRLKDATIAKNLRLVASPPAKRKILEILEGIDAIFRSLYGNVVADAVLRIDPKGWRSLKTAAQRHQQIVRDIVRVNPICSAFVRSDRYAA